MGSVTEDVAAVVLAGGFGTRVKHLLGDLPKPMAPVAGRPFVEWVLRYLSKQGIHRTVLSTGYRAETVEKHFRKSLVPGMAVDFAVEAKPLGTAGGFLNAVRLSSAKAAVWIVLNGDSLVFASLPAAIAALSDPEISGAIVGRTVPDASRYGTLVANPAGELVKFDEKRPGKGVINSGIYVLRQSLLADFPARIPLSFEQGVFPELIRRGRRLRVMQTEAPFLDIGTPETLPQAEEFIRHNAGQFA